MLCEICGTDVEGIMLLPIKHPDGRLETLSCLLCAKKSKNYCLKHEIPHVGFVGDDTTACHVCINELVMEGLGRSDSLVDIMSTVLPSQEWMKIHLWLKMIVGLTNDSAEKCLLRAFITKQLRMKAGSIDVVIHMVVDGNSADPILP